MFKKINKMLITLILKFDNLESTNDFRPISLCNICYKIIIKILANRIILFLNKIMSPLQRVFAPRKLINDNITFTYEIMHSF